MQNHKKFFIVVPTYNEKENITTLINEIFNLNINNLNVLVVDDNSPDCTGKIVEGLKNKYSNLEIIHRQKKLGLGTAYVEGFKKVIAQRADIIFEMDADLSHDPNAIPNFLKAINNYDLVLGSRYIKEGNIKNWNFFRRLVSKFGNIYARVVLDVPIKDLTGGFKCYRREVLEKINLDELSSLGYNFQIETTFKAYKLGFKIKEIPITFTERKFGGSKFNLKIILESFYKVLLLRFKKI